MAINDLTTLSYLKEWLGNSDVTGDDPLLTRLITACSGFIQSYIGRSLLSQSYTERYDGKDGHVLNLANFPVTEVNSLTIHGVSIPAASNMNEAGYMFSNSQILLNGYYFIRGLQNVEITYTAGFATVPPDIEQACIALCALRYRERDRIGQVSKSLANEVITFSQKDMSDDIKTLLQTYKTVIPV